MKNKRKLLKRVLTVAMAMIMVMSIFFAMPLSTSAATNRAGSYTISGYYNIGDGSKSGYLSNFRITIGTQYFYDDSGSVAQTKYNFHTFDWTYFKFYIYTDDIDSHTSFKLYRNGSVYVNESLSGDGDGYLYQGSLPDGDYVLTYEGKYWSGAFTKKTYNFTYNFTVDTTPPSASLMAGGSYISSGSYTNKDIKFSASDSYSTEKIYYKAPSSSSYNYVTSTSKSVTASSSNNGRWYFYASDGYQSSSTYSVYLDTVSPTGTIKNSSGSTLSSGSYTNSPVKYSATDTGGVSYCQVITPSSSSWADYSAGTALSSSQGWYYFRAVDKASNTSSTSSVYYDATKPYGILYSGTTSRSSGSSVNSSYIKYQAYDSHSGVSSIYVRKPNSSSYTSYTSGTQLTDAGTYYFYCIDRSGNYSDTVSITIDRTIPTAQLYVDGEAVGNGTYTNGDYISFVSDGSCFVKLPDSDGFIQYVSGTEFNKSGKYVFYAKDEAENSTGEYIIVIDRTVKSVTLSNVSDGKTDGDVTVGWTDGDGNIYAPISSITVNGVSVDNGDIIHTIATGEYTVVVADLAGNTWETSFTSSKKNILTDTLQKEYFETADGKENIFSFESHDNAFAFAAERENSYVIRKTWSSSIWDAGIPMDAKDSVNAANGEYFIYKKSGSPDEFVAYFTVERLNEVIAEYADASIKSYYYWQKEPATVAEGEDLYSDSSERKIVAYNIILGENIGTLLDGETFTEKVITAEGNHTVTVLDRFGNICEYTVTIVRSTPQVHYSIGDGTLNEVAFDRTYYFKDDVTVSITDGMDEYAMFRVLDKQGNIVSIKSLGESFTLTDSGEYTVIAVNHAGDSQDFKVLISRSSPMVDMKADAAEKQLLITVTPSKDRESHIQTFEIFKSTDGGITWQTLTEDDYGTEILTDRYKYEFRTSGLYKVVLTDEFRTGIDAVTATLDYVQPFPIGLLDGVENGGHTNSRVRFIWEDEAMVTVKKNGETIDYRSGDIFNEDGEYVIIFENYDGDRLEYSFVIDSVKPEISVQGARGEEPAMSPVTVNFDATEHTAVIFKNGIKASYTSGTQISEHGRYTILVSDKAGNISEVVFVIDTKVDFTANVHNASVSTSVTITPEEDITLILTKDGETVEYKYGTEITEAGEYVVTMSDKYGNCEELRFTVVNATVCKLVYNFDAVDGFERVLIGGEEKRLNYGTLELFEDGTYEVEVIAKGISYSFNVTVDAVAPTLTLDGVTAGGTTKGTVIITDISHDASMKVYLDGKPIDYELGEKLKEIGVYKVVLEDKAGNVSEYSFEILWKMPSAVIVLIVVGVLGIVGTVVWLIISNKRKKEYYN